jgi:light-independent protochlorophyllide reductase subunit L
MLDEIRKQPPEEVHPVRDWSPRPQLKAVQDEYMRLAASLWLGSDPLPAVPDERPRHFRSAGF